MNHYGIYYFWQKYLIMQTASFSGLLKVILYFFAFYYAFKFLARLFLPVLVKKVVDKAGQNFQQYHSYQNTSADDPIRSNTPKSDKPRETKKVGEYVDYEEIE
jgi:hypothetical protein